MNVPPSSRSRWVVAITLIPVLHGRGAAASDVAPGVDEFARIITALIGLDCIRRVGHRERKA